MLGVLTESFHIRYLGYPKWFVLYFTGDNDDTAQLQQTVGRYDADRATEARSLRPARAAGYGRASAPVVLGGDMGGGLSALRSMAAGHVPNTLMP